MKCYIKNISSVSPQHTFGVDALAVGVVAPKDGMLKAIEPDYKTCIPDAGLRRRMSHIVKMGVAAGLACIGDCRCDAILTATGLGCLADTERFLKNIVEDKEQLLNPTSFIQSTFNTIGGQIALVRKLNCYNVTYVHRGFSFESALTDALLQMESGEAKTVLVGAVDEITETEREVMGRLGFWRGGTVMGEGAQFFLLGSEDDGNAVARLCGVEQFRLADDECVEARIETFLLDNALKISDVDLILLGETGDKCLDAHFIKLRDSYLNDCKIEGFKYLCGEYPTASSFALWYATMAVKEKKANRVLIYNTYRGENHSLFLVEQSAVD